jgi:hypothetical protein
MVLAQKKQYYVYNINKKILSVHRLIAETFLDNSYNKKTVDHIDRNTVNNDINNLRWATMKEQLKNRE